jgi:hypothetical protein
MQLYQIHLHLRICSFVKHETEIRYLFIRIRVVLRNNILEPFQWAGEAFILTCNNGIIGIFVIIKLWNV